MKWKFAPAALFLAAVVGCSAAAEPAAPQVLAADPWVRTTDGAERPEMTAVFVSLTNPSEEDRVLVKADCGDVAQKVELHVMEKVDGEMVMKEAEGGLPIPAGKHEHLAPGGPHIMLMGLTRELPAGSEEVECTLTLDDGQSIEIVAPVKQFTEEQDTYHTHEADG
ncbi:copper chaperone PCu(A)C [Tessaracoccus flavus]|uniref:copper chaperone PCu(A)C n=1 Tax=Tessaracoccus flavus TaxID=1610493 RepID=UPI0008954F17|nr:copper chaperone PCu(A)C [Tessaracoccus flavus]SDY56739.1 hypothetical protein SAMN05428934_102292 [Tessaracoccus flavus]